MKTGYTSSNDVYWRIYQSTKSQLMTVVCMQWFDESDYHHERFVTDSSLHPYMFDSEAEAVTQLNLWFEKDQIDPEYRGGQSINLIR